MKIQNKRNEMEERKKKRFNIWSETMESECYRAKNRLVCMLLPKKKSEATWNRKIMASILHPSQARELAWYLWRVDSQREKERNTFHVKRHVQCGKWQEVKYKVIRCCTAWINQSNERFGTWTKQNLTIKTIATTAATTATIKKHV